jgi:large subunit ribosomal protein LX
MYQEHPFSVNTFIIGNALDVVQEMKIMKAFKVTGEINKPELHTPFTREVIADKSEHAVEKVYAEIGSRHRVKRYHIKITSAKEVSADEVENPILKKLLTGEQ